MSEKINEILFTIAIPTYNRRFLLEKILEKLLTEIQNLNYLGEILVIDDYSSDTTKEYLEEIKNKFPSIIRYKINHENLGISKTRNILVKNSKGKYIIFIDSDVIPCNDFIIEHLKLLINNKNIICQGSLILIPKFEDIDNKKKSIFTDFSSAFFDTANVSIEKRHIIDAGYFDEGFSKYGWEDLELGIRLRNNGLKVIKCKKSIGYHIEPFIKINELDKYIEKEIQRARGAIYFYKKHKTFEVKMMTQLTFFHFYLDLLLSKLLKIENNTFINILNKLYKNNNYNLYISLVRLYLNHYNIKELKRLLNNF